MVWRGVVRCVIFGIFSGHVEWGTEREEGKEIRSKGTGMMISFLIVGAIHSTEGHRCDGEDMSG